MNSIFHLMTLNRVKLGSFYETVTLMKYLASVVSLIFLSKILIWNKITFPASTSLNSVERVENVLMKTISIKIYQFSFFYPTYCCLW